MSGASDREPWVFGESPLPETVEFTEAVRDLMCTVLSLERPWREVQELTSQLRAVQQRLAPEAPADLSPRVGTGARPEQRVYLDHSRNVGRYNACVPDYEMSGWFGILAPAGTPPTVAQRLRDEVAKAVAATDVVATLDSQGMVPLATQPGDWAKYLQSELAVYTKITKDANIKPE